MSADPSIGPTATTILETLIIFLSNTNTAIITEPFKSVITALSGAAIAIFAEPVRQWLFRPNIVLSFNNDEECVSHTFLTTNPSTARGPNAVYIRVRIKNTRNRMARECRGYLTGFEKRNDEGKFVKTEYCDSIMLHWSCQRAETKYLPVHIPSGVNQFLDIVSLEENKKSFSLQTHIVLNRYHDLLHQTGVFRFTIQVVADNAKPKTIRLIFEWSGEMKKFKVYKDS